jgi:hypothetical protein
MLVINTLSNYITPTVLIDFYSRYQFTKRNLSHRTTNKFTRFFRHLGGTSITYRVEGEEM